MSTEQIQQDMRMRDLWSNNMLIAIAATVILSFLLPVANESGSLVVFMLVSLLELTALGFLGIAIYRWVSLRKQVRKKIAHRQWIGKTS